MTDNFKNILINLNFKPSVAFSSSLVVNLIDFLLWNRTQIPFTVDIMQKFLENKNLEDIKCFKKLKAVKNAKETYDKICWIKELTKSEYNSSKSLIIIFGSSIQTAKEAYKIYFPSTSSTIPPTFLNDTSNLRKIFLQLIQSDDLKEVLENPLAVTNTFVLFERKCSDEKINENLFEIRNFKLNKSCKKFSINFKDSLNFEVFQEDFEMLKICDDEIVVEEKVEEVWMQSKIFVKGFNDVILDNRSLWS